MVRQSHRVWHAKLERKITLYEVTWSEPQPGGAAISHAVWHRYATRTGARMLSSLSHSSGYLIHFFVCVSESRVVSFLRRYQEFAELREDLLQLLREEAPARLPLLEVTAVTALFDAHVCGRSDLRMKRCLRSGNG